MLKFFLTINLLIFSVALVCGQKKTVENPNLFPIYERGKVGYIDITGKKVIEPQLDIKGNFNKFNFTPAEYFQEGVAAAGKYFEETGKLLVGFIDQTGKFVIPPVYEQALQFSEGLAAVQTDGKWGFINHDGVMVIAPQLVEADLFKDGFAVVTHQNKRRGLIDRTGKFLKMPHGVQGFVKASENRIAVKIKGKWGFINQQGQLVIKPRFEPELNDYNDDEYLGEFLNGLAIVRMNDKWGYVNRQGKMVIPAKFHGAMQFQKNGLAIISLGLYDWRIINRRGDFVSQRKFEDLHDFSEGLAGVLINYQWGFINPKCQIVIPAKFDGVGYFSDGLAAAKINGKWGFIDRTGKFVIEPSFKYESYFSNGLAQQITKGDFSIPNSIEWGYLDRTRKFVWSSE